MLIQNCTRRTPRNVCAGGRLHTLQIVSAFGMSGSPGTVAKSSTHYDMHAYNERTEGPERACQSAVRHDSQVQEGTHHTHGMPSQLAMLWEVLQSSAHCTAQNLLGQNSCCCSVACTCVPSQPLLLVRQRRLPGYQRVDDPTSSSASSSGPVANNGRPT